ncbi:MAG: L-lactate permease [Pseudomonadota bacterium]
MVLALLAAAPILVATIVIVGLGQSALRAGSLGLLCALAISWIGGLFTDTGVFGLPGSDAIDATTRALLATGNVSYVLFGGVLLYHVLRAGGALAAISDLVVVALPRREHTVLTLVFGVSVFFESATGFGVGIVVVAPLFLALGYPPLKAAFLALLGQCAVPWGALAIGTELGSDLTGIPMVQLATLGIPLSLPFVIIVALSALSVAGELDRRVSRVAIALMYALVSSVTLGFFSHAVATELAGCLSGLVICVFGWWLSNRGGGSARCDSIVGQTGDARKACSLRSALLPPGILLAGLFLTRAVPTIRDVVEPVARVVVPQYDFSVSLVYHSGFWLVLAAAVGLIGFRLTRDTGAIINGAFRQWLMAALAVLVFLILGHVMLSNGMTEQLARTLVAMAGGGFAWVSPFIGAIGGFLTASNAASNALFMPFQMNAANALGLSGEWVGAAQNAAGSNGTLASPGRVIFAASIVGESGAEGRLLRRALPMIVLATLGMSAALVLVP